MRTFFSTLLILLIIFLIWFLWAILTQFLFSTHSSESPMLKERFGTIMWHSSDKDGIYLGSYNDPNAVDHNYCYYPKASAKTNLVIKRVDNGDCSNWYGQVTFREGSWISEREKYQWN